MMICQVALAVSSEGQGDPIGGLVPGSARYPGSLRVGTPGPLIASSTPSNTILGSRSSTPPLLAFTMTNEEQELLITYLVDAGEIDPEGDVEAPVHGLVSGSEGPGVWRDALKGGPGGRPGQESELRPRVFLRMLR